MRAPVRAFVRGAGCDRRLNGSRHRKEKVMDDIADNITAFVVTLTAIGVAAFGVYLLAKGFGWARRLTK